MAQIRLGQLKWLVLALVAVAIAYAYGSKWLVSPSQESIDALASQILLSILVLILAKAAIILTTPLFTRLLARPESRPAAAHAWAWVLWVSATFLILSIFIGPTMFLVAALLAFGFAIAFRSPLLSLIGWAYISMYKIYSVGDTLQIGNQRGDVLGVGLLSTTLWEFDPDAAETGRRITFPNSKLFGSEYSILKNGEKHIWDSVSFSLPLNSDYSKQKDALLQACDEILGAKKMAANAKEQQEQLISNGVSPNTPQQPEVLVSLSGDHLEITLRYLVGSPQKAQIKSEISERVLSLLAKKR